MLDTRLEAKPDDFGSKPPLSEACTAQVHGAFPDPQDMQCFMALSSEANKQTNKQTDGRTDGRTNKQTDGRTDERTNQQTNKQTTPHMACHTVHHFKRLN